jgi:hypothetical protein
MSSEQSPTTAMPIHIEKLSGQNFPDYESLTCNQSE